MSNSEDTRVAVVCTSPGDCFNTTFKVVDNRTSDALELTCKECGHTQTWSFNNN